MMDAKRRKISQENRMFQPQWTNSYFFILPSHKNAKPTCLICSETVAVNKTENVKRHFQSKHKKFETDYPNGSQIRSDKISSLIVMYERSKSLLKHSLTEQEKCLEASFRISWVLAKNMAPFQHSEMIKECMIEASGALFDNKKEIIESFKKIPLSNNSATRRVETCSQSIHDALYADLQKTEFFSLAIDESTDITDIAQMSVFVRFLSDNKFSEELLAILPLKDRTTGEMLFNSFQDFMNVNNLSFANILSLTTDGAPAMTGKINGFVALAKNKNPNILGFHCIIHQSVLCAKLSGEFKKTMDTVMKIVNHLRSHSSLQHRLLRSFLQECNADYPDLLAYNNVRWLSKGNVLKRVFALLPEIREFLQNRNTKVAAEYLEFLSGEENVSMIAFMADLFSHFNELNLYLQGKDKLLCDIWEKIKAFERKLSLFESDLTDQEFLYFPSLKASLENTEDAYDLEQYVQLLKDVRLEFSVRFEDFVQISDLFHLLKNPFSAEPSGNWVSQAVQLFSNINKAAVKLELIEFQENIVLRDEFQKISQTDGLANFWVNTVRAESFPNLKKIAIMSFTMFGSTYLCEAAFSKMNFIKNKYRSSLTNEHLKDCMIAATTSYVPDFRKLAQSQKAHFSH